MESLLVSKKILSYKMAHMKKVKHLFLNLGVSFSHSSILLFFIYLLLFLKKGQGFITNICVYFAP